ncbi:type VI secretion system spike protein VgrG1b [soil metagenome]
MAGLSQAKRPIRVSTTLGPDAFMLQGFRGDEAISRPFVYTLDLVSEDPQVDGKALLRSEVTLTVPRPEAEDLHVHGLVRKFIQLGQSEGLTFYRAEVVPWLWLLGLHRDCRIFQEMSAPDIVEKVFKEHGFSDFDFRLSGSYPAREYCVQYRESDLNFVSRLLEQEGIHYFFEHSKDQHLLVLADRSTLAKACDGGETQVAVDARERKDVVRRLRATHGVYVGAVELRDFDFKEAPEPLWVRMSGDGEEQVYDYHPGRFTSRDEGERYARLALEADEVRHQVVTGNGNCRYIRPGYRFDLVGHYRGDLNSGYFLTEVVHEADGGDWRSGDGGTLDYRVDFAAVPVDVPFRPRRRTSKPRISGSQTAVVVGKEGEEIWVDKFGRVKVKFHWDRSDPKDESASCWVRVSTSWAGKNWGAIQIPRIGEEVIVDFLEGDPDQPIIIGRVYNGDHMPPYDLPANKTQSGVKSRSSKDAESKNFNEIRFEDLKGKEQFYIQAEKNKVVLVKNDRTETVHGNETITIKKDRTENVEKNESITIGEDRTESVGKNETITIAADRTEDVGGDEVLKVEGDRSHSVGGDEALSVSGDASLTVNGDRTESVTGDITVDSKGKILIKALTSIELKVGANSIKIENSGITVKGIQVKIEGSAMAEMKAPMVKVDGSAMVEVKGGGMAKVEGGGMLMAKGGITMIN